MTEEQTMNPVIAQMHLDWLKEDLESMPKIDRETLPALKLVEGKLVKVTILVDKPFTEYTDALKGVTKKIIPVMHNGEKKILWLNKRNPLYSQLAKKLLTGETTFFISTTGTQDQTKYHLFDPTEDFTNGL